MNVYTKKHKGDNIDKSLYYLLITILKYHLVYFHFVFGSNWRFNILAFSLISGVKSYGWVSG